MDQKSLYQIYRACRLCGAQGGYKMPIIQDFLELDDTDIRLKEKICESLQTQVFEGDKMPPLICELCADKVNEYYAFKKLCKETNELTKKKLGLSLQEVPEITEKLPIKKEQPESPKKDKTLLKKETDLKTKETKLKERDIELKSRDKALRVKEIDLKHRESALKVKETQIKEKESQLKLLDAVLKNKDVELTLLQDKIKAKQQEVKALEARKKEVEEKEALLRKREADLKRKEYNLTRSQKYTKTKLENERKKLLREMDIKLKEETLKLTRELEQSILKNQSARSSRSSSVSKTSKSKKSSEMAVESSVSQTDYTAEENVPISELQMQEEVTPKLKRSKEQDETKTEAPPSKKARPSPKTAEVTSPNRTPVNKSTPVAKSISSENQCVVCNVVHKTYKAFRNHLRSHHVGYTNPRHACNACHLWFHNYDETQSHHKKHVTMNIPYKCSNCEVSFTTEKDYQEHFKKLDCYIYTVPDVQCAACWKYFATETLKSRHPCEGEDGRGPGVCSMCKKEFPLLKEAKQHEAVCDSTPKAPQGPANIIADAKVLASLLPAQVRTERCDDLLKTMKQDVVDVSNVAYDYGLDKSYAYPYFSLYPRIKQEPGRNHFEGMVKINQDIKEEFIGEDFGCWDSEESDKEMSDSISSGHKVKTLAKLALKVIFTNKLIEKVPKKRRRTLNDDSVLDISGLNDNLDDINASVGNNIGNPSSDILDKVTDIDVRIAEVTDEVGKYEHTVMTAHNETRRSENFPQSEKLRESGMDCDTQNTDAHVSQEKPKPGYEDMNIPHEETSNKCDTEQDVDMTDGSRNAEPERIIHGKAIEKHDFKIQENTSAIKVIDSKESIDLLNKDTNPSENVPQSEICKESNMECGTKNVLENANIENTSRTYASSNLVNEKPTSQSNECIESNTDSKMQKPTDSDNMERDQQTSEIISEKQDIAMNANNTEIETYENKGAEEKSPISSVQSNSDLLVENDSRKDCTNIDFSSISKVTTKNYDKNELESNNHIDTKNTQESIDFSNAFSRDSNCIPFFESEDEKIISKVSKLDSSEPSSTETVSYFDPQLKKVEKEAENAEANEMDKLMKDLNELSQDDSSSDTSGEKENDSEIDDGKLMSDLNEQINEKDNLTNNFKNTVNSEVLNDKSNDIEMNDDELIEEINEQIREHDDISNNEDLNEQLADIQEDIDASESRSLGLSNVSDEEFNFSS